MKMHGYRLQVLSGHIMNTSTLKAFDYVSSEYVIPCTIRSPKDTGDLVHNGLVWLLYQNVYFEDLVDYLPPEELVHADQGYCNRSGELWHFVTLVEPVTLDVDERHNLARARHESRYQWEL